MLMRIDPFRQLDRLTQQVFGNTPGTWSRPAAMPMDAYRAGDEFVVAFDLPGVSPDAIELDVERHVLTSQASDEEISVAAACSVLERLEPGGSTSGPSTDVWADSDLLAIGVRVDRIRELPDFGRPSRTVIRRRDGSRSQTGRTPTPHHVGRRARTPAPARRRPARRRAVARERGPPATTTATRPTVTAILRSSSPTVTAEEVIHRTASTGPVAALPPTCHGRSFGRPPAPHS